MNYAEFLENVSDPDGKVKWIKGVKYKITYKTDDLYYLGKQNDITTAIDRALEGTIYKIGEIVNPRSRD